VEVQFTSDITVKMIDSMADDVSIARAAWVSTKGERAEDEINTEKIGGLINYLMKHRHGTPFEHNAFTFLVKAPIFVFREWHRHRVAWSYNEVSGRYSVLPPLFYIPPKHRPLINAGTSARPKFEPGTAEQYQLVKTSLEANAYDAYDRYTTMLENGIGNEVARMVLPVNTFTAMYATANARSIMHFLSLRTEHDDAAYPSHPMWEIAQAAETMEEFFKGQFPITHEAFVKNGRVAP